MLYAKLSPAMIPSTVISSNTMVPTPYSLLNHCTRVSGEIINGPTNAITPSHKIHPNTSVIPFPFSSVERL